MKVVVNKSALEDTIKFILEQRDPNSIDATEIIGNSDFSEDEPIVPTPMMATQLAVEAPPVEDPNFIPGSTTELSRAASLIAEAVPSAQIGFFYRRLHQILDEALDKNDEIASEESAGLASWMPVAESKIKALTSLILEQDDIDDEIFAQTEDEALDIGDATQDVIDYLESQHVGYSADEYESSVYKPGMKFRKPEVERIMLIELSKYLTSDRKVIEILSTFEEPAKKEIVKRVREHYKDTWKSLKASQNDLDQIEANRKVSDEAKKLGEEYTNEEIVEILLQKAEEATDDLEKNAYREIAGLIKTKDSIDDLVVDEDDFEKPEVVLTPDEEAEILEKNLKKLDSLAPFFGFKNASGIRQWRRKYAEPKFKVMVGSEMGFDAYNDYAEFIKDNMAALLDSLIDVLDTILTNINQELETNPDDEALGDWKQVLGSLQEDFEKMQETSLESEDGFIDDDLMLGTDGGRVLREAFSDIFMHKEFSDFAGKMKKHMVKFLTDLGVDSKVAGTFGKMFNGEVDLVDFNDSSKQAQKIRDGGITPDIYKMAVKESEKFTKGFFTGERKKISSTALLKKSRDKSLLADILQASIIKTAETDEIERQLSIASLPDSEKEKLDESAIRMLIKKSLRI
jgi:hypothetical protein